MALLHSYSINDIFVIFVHCSKIKLLVNTTENSQVCINNKKNALSYQVF